MKEALLKSILRHRNFILHLVRGKLKVQIHGFDKTIQDQGIMVCGTDDIQIESIDQETYLIIYQLSNKLLNTHSNKSTIQLETKNHRCRGNIR